MTVVLKLGGSVITDKDTPETVDRAALDAASSTIAAYGDTDLVIVHGGGSFGHHHAAAHGVSRTAGTHDDTAVRDVHRAMKRLNEQVVDALAAVDVPAIPVHPLSVAHRSMEDELRLPSQQVRTLLTEGFVPVLHGDVIGHEAMGATILSGDELVCALAEALSADRVGLCSAVPGVLDGEDVIPEINDFEDVAHVLGASESTDVTGGMAGKVRALLDLETPAFVFDRGGLEPFLMGRQPGTRIG
ncbi:isopentenyl phosphate kinase [Halocatena salina]|uniref:Isopentenyl phosphate kinase n=1 Tax=Halocatena salina TaxID=2934340 RepID=A0A8U0A2J0_9EURY|nr:isopentenyl phosphate kinase [Halocatena salina]UPM43274.1 isopentenyl phosphate kinase [Halocatena salina]